MKQTVFSLMHKYKNILHQSERENGLLFCLILFFPLQFRPKLYFLKRTVTTILPHAIHEINYCVNHK